MTINTQVGAITLSETEQQRLHHKERVIERGAQQIGEALRDIRDERLYRETHGTFEAYCEQRWSISRSYAHRQIEAAEVAALLPMGNNLPERQARELAPLRDDPEKMREVWDAANAATGGKPTAAAIRAARTPETESDCVTDKTELVVNHETGEILDTTGGSTMPTAAPTRLAIPQPPKYGGNRRKHREQIEALVIAIAGGTSAFDGVRRSDDFDQSITSEEATRLMGDLSEQIRSLSRIRNLLKECTK